MRFLGEFIIVFVFIYIVNYFMLIKNKTKYQRGKAPAELIYLKKVYNINLRKINYKRFVYVNAILNTFIISVIYMIVMYLLSSLVLRIIVGVVLLVLLIIICYGFLGRYYLWKESKE